VWISCSENSPGGPKYLIRFTVVDMAVRIPTSKNFVSVLKLSPGSEADFHEEQCSTGPERKIADLNIHDGKGPAEDSYTESKLRSEGGTFPMTS
jgi:hypothetical protein